MTDIKETATAVNFTLMKLVLVYGEDNESRVHLSDEKPHELDLPSVVDVLTQFLMHNSIQTKVAVLKWIHHLYTKLPDEVFNIKKYAKDKVHVFY